MTFDEFKAIVLKEFPGLTGEQLERFAQMEALYKEWNSRINVISRKDIDGFYEHHVLHSLAIAAYWLRSASAGIPVIPGLSPVLSAPDLIPSTPDHSSAASGFSDCTHGHSSAASDFSDCTHGHSSAASNFSDCTHGPTMSPRFTVLDVGTGGGFPGIPLAVMFPDIDFTLCDSVGKKTLVAREVASALGLQNVTVVNARAESLPDSYDFVVSRAVTTLENFYPWVRGKFRGSIFYLKGGDVNEEISQLMRRNRLKKGSVRTWRIDNWLKEEYFQEKFVIQIEKDYLCSPIAENI